MTRDEREAMGLQPGSYFGVAPDDTRRYILPVEPRSVAWFAITDAAVSVLDVLAKPREERA